MHRSTRRWPATSAAAAPISASARRSTTPRVPWPEEATMIIDHLVRQSFAAAAPIVTRRRFVAMSVGGSVGLALLPWVSAQQKAADVPPGQKPTEQPSAFVTIAPDGTTTVI